MNVCVYIFGLFNDPSHRSKDHVPIHYIPLILGDPYYLFMGIVVKSQLTGILPFITINN